jgi:hypothetical protein
MTITSNILRKDYTANGVNTTFAFDFPIFYESNATPKFSLEVIITDILGVEATKIETTDYTITYNQTDYLNGVIAQGNVVLNTAPTLNYKVSILRKLNFTQNNDITTSGSDALPGTALEGSLDKLTLMLLETKENLNRVIKLPKSSILTNIEFPIGASQANQVIVINNDGNNLTTKDLADVGLAPVSAFAKTLLDDLTAAEARTTLNTQQLNANLTALAGLTGALNKLPYFNGLGSMVLRDLFATSTAQGINYLPLPVDPITAGINSITPNTDVDFFAGTMTLNDNSAQAKATAMTKRLQSTGAWSVGNNGNMLLSGARANSSTYHLFAMYKTDGTVDYGALLGVAGTTPDPTNVVGTSVLPSGYTKYQYIASLLTDASGNIRRGSYSYRLDGSYYFEFNTPVESRTFSAAPTTATLQTVAVPLGIKFNCELACRGDTGIELYSLITDPQKTTTASSTNFNGYAFNNNGSVGYNFYSKPLTNTSAQVSLMSTYANNLQILTKGYTYNPINR